MRLLKASLCEGLFFVSSVDVFGVASWLFPSGRLAIRQPKTIELTLRSPVVKPSKTCLLVFLPKIALFSSGT